MPNGQTPLISICVPLEFFFRHQCQWTGRGKTATYHATPYEARVCPNAPPNNLPGVVRRDCAIGKGIRAWMIAGRFVVSANSAMKTFVWSVSWTVQRHQLKKMNYKIQDKMCLDHFTVDLAFFQILS